MYRAFFSLFHFLEFFFSLFFGENEWARIPGRNLSVLIWLIRDIIFNWRACGIVAGGRRELFSISNGSSGSCALIKELVC